METKKYSPNLIICVCSLVYFVSYLARKDFAAVLAGILADGVMDKAAAGLIGTAMFICYGAGQLISGYLGDRIKPELLMLSGLSATAICNLLMPLVDSPTLMIFVWGINGLAQAMLWPPIVRILADNLDSESFVRANLYVTSAAHIATVILYIYVPVCLRFFEWRTVFFTATALTSVAFCIFIALMSKTLFARRETANDAPVSQKRDEKTEKYGKLVVASGLISVFFSIIAMGYLRDGIESWLPTLYSEVFSREASESVLFSAVLPIFSILSVTAITALHKTRLFDNEVRGSLITFLASILLSVPVIFLINATSLFLRILCLALSALVAACMHASNFLLISCLPGRFARMGRAATTSGFSNACTYIGAAVSMYGMGSIADSFGWSAVIISWIAVGALGVVFSLIALRSYTKFIGEK